MKMFRHLALAAVLSLGASAALTQDFLKAGAAFAKGDYQTAFREYLLLANQEDELAQLYVASMYARGKGTKQNNAEALKWYLKANSNGVETAKFGIGRIYEEGGMGVLQDYSEALKWYRSSAEQKNGLAQGKLGSMYEFGRGVSKNNTLAHMWYNLGSANGDKDAANHRDDIAANMTPEDISKAQAMANECMSSGYANCGW